MLLWTTTVNEEHYPILEKLKETGYDGVEIPISDGTASDYRRLGNKLKELGLGCTCVTSVFEAENPVSPDPAIRQKGVDQLKWRIDMGAELGAEVIAGPYHSAFALFSGAPPTAEERKWSAEVLHKAAEYAEGTGIILTPEALNRFECYLFNTLGDICELVRAVDHPNLKMIFDTHHAHIEEKDVVKAIETYAPYFGHVHISENDRGIPGSGQVRWDEVFSTLRRTGYNSWLTIEAFSRNNPEFASGINVWRNFAPDLESVYREGYAFISQKWEEFA